MAMHECTYEKYVHVYITCSLRNCIVYTHKIHLIFDNFDDIAIKSLAMINLSL